MARALVKCRVRTANISLDTLDREMYQLITGRDFLPQTLEGIAAAKEAGFEKVKLNAVLMRGRNEDVLPDLVRFARAENLLLRFIELMPVTTTDVLTDAEFSFGRGSAAAIGIGSSVRSFRIRNSRRMGRRLYFRFADSQQRIGFIGAMTNLHFCESCNKLRLTCEGKLRPCLGSHLEFDIKTPMRQGASDEQLRRFFGEVVERKPEQHDFRYNYQPGRRMVAIGG